MRPQRPTARPVYWEPPPPCREEPLRWLLPGAEVPARSCSLVTPHSSLRHCVFSRWHFLFFYFLLADCFQSRMRRSVEGSCPRVDSSNTVLRGAAASSVCSLSGLFFPPHRKTLLNLPALHSPRASRTHTHHHGSAGKITLQM